MLEEKKISIIVPICNVCEYVGKCIESIINQTYKNLEIMLVDDGSTDESGTICDRYASLDSRIRVFHKENGGLSDARNYAIERATGDLIGFIDGDDWIHPQMYELLSHVMEQQKADVVTCGFEQKDIYFGNKRYTLEELMVETMSGTEAISNIDKPLVVAWNKLYRKEIFKDIRYPVGKIHEDEYVIHRIFYLCKSVSVIQQPLYFYTIRNGSIVAKMEPRRIYNSLEAFEDRVKFADEMNWEEVLPVAITRYCDYCIDRYFEIEAGRYELLDDSFLKLLWRSEQKLLDVYKNTAVDAKYRKFAKSPTKYKRYLNRRNRIESVRQVVWQILKK